MTWDNTKPGDSEGVSASVVGICANWVALSGILEVNHAHSISATQPGHHPDGISILVACNTTGDFISDGEIGEGAVWFSKYYGTLNTYSRTSSAWAQVLSAHAMRVIRHDNTAQDLAVAATGSVRFATLDYDPLSASGVTSASVPVAGYYLIQAHVDWIYDNPGCTYTSSELFCATDVSSREIMIEIDGAVVARDVKWFYTRGVPDISQRVPTEVFDIQPLSAGSTICICATHSRTISAQIERRWLAIERLS